MSENEKETGEQFDAQVPSDSRNVERNSDTTVTDITKKKYVKVKKKQAIAIAAAIVAVCVIVAVAVFVTQGKTEQGNGCTLSNEKIEIIDGLAYITGNLKNTTGNFESFLLDWEVYDENGKRIGEAFGNVENILAGDTKPFKAAIGPDDLDTILTYQEHCKSFKLLGANPLKAEISRLQNEINYYERYKK